MLGLLTDYLIVSNDNLGLWGSVLTKPTNLPVDIWTFARDEILEFWESLPPSGRPSTFWFAEHDRHPETAFDICIDIPTIRCCYFDGRAFKNRELSSYLAFVLVPGIAPGGLNKYEIGRAGFARLESSNDFLLYWQFAGLFGAGYRYSETNDGFSASQLWVS